MKGFGTDEKTLIRVLANKDPYQVEAIRAAFHRNLGRDLVKDIRSETSGYFEKGLVQLVHGPQNTDVWLLHDSMDGPGTKEKLLNDILLGRSNADLQAIKHAYKQVHRRNLEDAVKGDLSMKTERHFMMVLACNRAEDSAPVIPQQVDDDVNKLYQATEGRMGTDELTVCSILTQRNDNQIRAIDHAYSQRYRKDLEKVIKSVSWMLYSAFEVALAKMTTGILRTYGGCSPLPVASRSRQVYARSHSARGCHGWHGYQGRLAPLQSHPGPLGPNPSRQREGGIPEEVWQEFGEEDSRGNLWGLSEASAGLCRGAIMAIASGSDFSKRPFNFAVSYLFRIPIDRIIKPYYRASQETSTNASSNISGETNSSSVIVSQSMA